MNGKQPKLKPRSVSATKHKRRRSKLTLSQYTENYLLSHEVGDSYAKQLRARIDVFNRWLGRDPKIAELDCDLVNEFIAALQETDLKPPSVSGYRRALRAVWFYAYENDDNTNAPLKLRRIRQPHIAVQCYTHVEIAKILATSASLEGTYVNGVKRSDFWQAAVHTAYCTGLRRGDLLRMKRSLITSDGQATVIQAKTGFPVVVRLSHEAMKFINAMRAVSEFALPWPHVSNWFSEQFTSIRIAAEVNRGSFKWLRRSAGSYADAEQSGTGSRLLGHADQRVFGKHYEDHAITRRDAVEPPTIAAPKIG